MVHDGLVMATRHRNGPDDFESTAGYGEYRWGPMTWTYGLRTVGGPARAVPR